MEEITKALELKSELDNLRPIDQEQEAIIMQKFRLDWNYHSNHLEGNSLTYGETKALILFGITAQGKTLKDHFEITGHNEAINWVIDLVKGERPLTENFIRELHTLLLKEPYEVDAITPDGKPTKKLIKVGSYKTTANHVKTKTGEIFRFATPEETPAKMFDLLHWYSQKTKEENGNPILVAAEFHYRFIRIHPFDDGNGRTARILMNFILMQFGFPPCIIKSDKESKDEYFSVLQLADAGNIEAFVTYIAKNLNRSLEIMIAGAKGESIEEDDDLDKEIALLEQRLNGAYKKSKNSNILLSKSLFDLLEFFQEKMSKFNNFYKLDKFLLFIDNTQIELEKELFLKNLNDAYVNEDFISNIQFNYIFSGFKKDMYNDIFYSSINKIIFEKKSYSIHINQGEFIFEKSMNESLSKNEIDKIVKSEVKRHKEFIEHKIAEKENK